MLSYIDQAVGVMEELGNGSGKFTGVTLHPEITISDSGNLEKAGILLCRANEMCFIANSRNFSVRHEPVIRGE